MYASSHHNSSNMQPNPPTEKDICVISALLTDGTNRKRPLQALSTLDEDANSMLLSGIGEEGEIEQPSNKSARHSAAAGGLGGVR